MLHKYIVFIDNIDRGVIYANDDDMAFAKATHIAIVLGYYPDDALDLWVERI